MTGFDFPAYDIHEIFQNVYRENTLAVASLKKIKKVNYVLIKKIVVEDLDYPEQMKLEYYSKSLEDAVWYLQKSMDVFIKMLELVCSKQILHYSM